MYNKERNVKTNKVTDIVFDILSAIGSFALVTLLIGFMFLSSACSPQKEQQTFSQGSFEVVGTWKADIDKNAYGMEWYLIINTDKTCEELILNYNQDGTYNSTVKYACTLSSLQSPMVMTTETGSFDVSYEISNGVAFFKNYTAYNWVKQN